jgi:hypothetical protein
MLRKGKSASSGRLKFSEAGFCSTYDFFPPKSTKSSENITSNKHPFEEKPDVITGGPSKPAGSRRRLIP